MDDATGRPDRERELDRAFLRFRDHGSTDALGRVFDELAPRLLLVAAHLTRDAARAEDLVQAAFLHAMRDARRYDGERPVEAWIAGILRHRAVDERRRAALRDARGLEAARDVPAGDRDPADLAADAELFEAVERAALALEDPYREVVTLRLVHGLAPLAIAHVLGRAPGTVRMQLKRGLERLRARVPAHGAWVALAFGDDARGLDAVREAVLAAARAPQAAPSADPSPAAPRAAWRAAARGESLGGALLAKALWTAVAAALAAVVWLGVRGGGARAPEPAEPPALAARGSARPAPAIPAEARAAAAVPADAAAPRRAAAAPLAPADLVVRVVHAADGAPAAGAGVYVRSAEREGLGVERRADQAGRAVFPSDALRPGVLEVHVDRANAPERVRWPEEAAVLLTIPPGLAVEGRVLDREGRGVPGARVLRLNPRHHDRLQAFATADADGRFAVRDVEDGLELLARAARVQPSELRTVRGSEDELELVLGARGLALSGRVLLPDGAPAAHAWVLIGVDEDAREAPEGSTRDPLSRPSRKAMDREGILVRADGAGRFATDEVPAGHVALIARAAEGAGADGLVGFDALWVQADVEQEIVLRLAPGARVDGVVRDRDGRGVEGVAVEAEWEGTAVLGQMEDDVGPLASDRATRTGADGAFTLEGLLPGEHDLRVRGERTELALEEVRLEPGQRTVWDPVVDAPAALLVRLLGPGGAPLAGWGVAAAEGGIREPRATDAEGRARLSDLRSGGTAIGAYPPRPSGGFAPLPAAVRAAVPAAGPDAEAVLRLAPGELPAARLAGRIVAADGGPAEGARLVLELAGWDAPWRASPGADGAFLFEAPPAAALRLFALGPGLDQPAEIGAWTLAPGEERDAGVLVVPDGAPLAVVLGRADGAPLGSATLELLPGDPTAAPARWVEAPWERDGDRYSTRAAPGAHRLRASAPGCAPRVERVVLPPRGASLALALDPAPEVRVLVRLDGVSSVRPRELRLRARAAGGAELVDRRVLCSGRGAPEGEWHLRLALAPGGYALSVEDRASGRTAEVALAVGAGGGAAELDLR